MNEVAQEPDLTPMLDVVFIMLIFFIVTATFVKEVGIDLPAKNDSPQSPQSDLSAVVDVSAQNRYYLNGKHVDQRALASRLAAFHAEFPDSQLIIRADPKSDTKNLVHVMDSGRMAGMSVAFAAMPST